MIHNKVIKIITEPLFGLYRVILSEKAEGIIVLAKLDSDNQIDDQKKNTQSKKEIKSKNKNIQLLWIDFSEIENLNKQNQILEVNFQPSAAQLKPLESSSNKNRHQTRIIAMGGFLEFENFRHRLLSDRNVGGLIQQALSGSKFSKPYLYKLFYLLCKYGFNENSLKPGYHNSGAPGVLRPYILGNKKVGRKSTKDRLSGASSHANTPSQPGLSEDWRNRILEADKALPSPKPKMPARILYILDRAFVKDYVQEGGKTIPVRLELGKYPTNAQIRRALKTGYKELDHLKHKTTQHHFISNNRGLTGKSWQGVSGPGHTYAIDSTIADLYLRSIVCLAWLIGRPIVYVIVDVWSTAVVGFYVCSEGPSWDMAKIALFCSVAPPKLIAELRNSNVETSLFPSPTLPAVLLCDRGEYLSKNASITGATLKLDFAYTPPYRGDLKGVNEVLHRIEKDKQYNFVPGAIDARRKEYELRKFKTDTAVFTVADYTRYLQNVFNEYNMTADRTHRLDAHMKSMGVHPSPAGLWKFGHEMGIGVQRHSNESELISSLLPQSVGKMTRNGLFANGLNYLNNTIKESEDATIARNSGTWSVPFNYYPGNMGKVWTTDNDAGGMTGINLSDYSGASKSLSFDELNDAHADFLSQKHSMNHDNLLYSLGAVKEREKMISKSKRNLSDYKAKSEYAIPTLTEARNIENNINNLNLKNEEARPQNQSSRDSSYREPHDKMLEKMFERMERNQNV